MPCAIDVTLVAADYRGAEAGARGGVTGHDAADPGDAHQPGDADAAVRISLAPRSSAFSFDSDLTSAAQRGRVHVQPSAHLLAGLLLARPVPQPPPARNAI